MVSIHHYKHECPPFFLFTTFYPIWPQKRTTSSPLLLRGWSVVLFPVCHLNSLVFCLVASVVIALISGGSTSLFHHVFVVVFYFYYLFPHTYFWLCFVHQHLPPGYFHWAGFFLPCLLKDIYRLVSKWLRVRFAVAFSSLYDLHSMIPFCKYSNFI